MVSSMHEDRRPYHEVANIFPLLQGAELLPMTEQEARETTNKIKQNLLTARQLLLSMYERKGWKVLGYGSWREYGAVEFGYSEAYVYRLMTAAKVENNISPIGEKAIPESQLRPLTALPPEQQREAWERAQEIAGDKPLVARDVQAAVNELQFFLETP